MGNVDGHEGSAESRLGDSGKMGVRSGIGGRRPIRLLALAILAGLCAILSIPFLPLEHAAAGVGFGVVPDFPSSVTVGNTGVPGTYTITNVSNGTQAVGNVTMNTMTMVPSCSNFNPGCSGGTA